MPTYFVFRQFKIRRGLLIGLIMLAALAAFELFNFSTTEYALATFFGGRYDALGIASWATVLAIAFCGIDFAGLARLFTPEQQWHKEPKEVRLLTGAWFLGAGMNAVMTWWAVAQALSENAVLGNELVSRAQILQTVPIFMAALVWLTRIMLIGTLAASGDRFFNRERGAQPIPAVPRTRPLTTAPAQPLSLGSTPRAPLPGQTTWSTSRSVPAHATPEGAYASPQARAADEPTYTPRRYDPPAASWSGSRAGDEPAAAFRRQEPTAAPSWAGSRASTVSTVRRDPPRGATPFHAPDRSRAAASAPANELTYVDVE